jgi:hypothetical protein
VISAGDFPVQMESFETMESSVMDFHEYVAQGDRVLVVGFANGKIKATGSAW